MGMSNKNAKLLILSTVKKRFQNQDALRIELEFSHFVNAIQVVKALLKYDKKWAFSISLDDGYADAYNNVFNMFYGKYPDLNNVIHNGYFFTDGCGNDVMYKSGFAGPLVDSTGYDFHHENQNAYVKWSEYEFACDFGFDMMYQQYGQPAIENLITYNDFYQDTINGRNYVYNKLEFKPIFGTCNEGNTGWINNEGKCPLYDAGCKIVGFNNTSATVAGVFKTLEAGLNIEAITNDDISNGIIMRRALIDETTDTNSLQTQINSIANDTVKRWLHYFTHRVTYTTPVPSASMSVAKFKSLMDYLHTNFGKGGLDNMWMASPQEVYEYLHAYHNSNIEIYYEGNRVIIVVKYNKPIDFRRAAISLKVNLPSSPTKIEVFNIASVTTNIATNYQNGLINIEWTPEIVSVANKFVTKAETTRLPKDKDFAQFMVNRITDLSLKSPLQYRINNIQPIQEKIFAFDFGAAGYWEQGLPWNSVTSATTGVKLTSFKEFNSGETVNYGLEITQAFYAATTVGNTPSTPNSGVYPDKVLKDSVYNSISNGISQSAIKITGLNNDLLYDFEFLANKSNIDTTTKYKIGTQEVSLFARDNFTNTVRIDNVSPINGEIEILVIAQVQQGHLNGMRIIEHG